MTDDVEGERSSTLEGGWLQGGRKRGTGYLLFAVAAPGRRRRPSRPPPEVARKCRRPAAFSYARRTSSRPRPESRAPASRPTVTPSAVRTSSQWYNLQVSSTATALCRSAGCARNRSRSPVLFLRTVVFIWIFFSRRRGVASRGVSAAGSQMEVVAAAESPARLMHQEASAARCYVAARGPRPRGVTPPLPGAEIGGR